MIAILAFLIVFVNMPWFIRFMKNRQIGQMVREEGPTTHWTKKGTPTMGGLMILGGVLIAGIPLFSFLQDQMVPLIWLIYMTFAYGAIGFLDDFKKTIQKSAYGLKAREDIALQILIALPFIVYMLQSSTTITSIFTLALFSLLVILSVTNAVNLTDGLDGLLAGIALPVFIFYFFYGLYAGFPAVSNFALIFAGALAGFLYFNAYPARIFMGNTGSFAIGGAIAGMALITGTAWILLILGAIFVLEALSVILQVGWFKYTKKRDGEGKRILRMSPFHHHFELAGYPEPFIVVRFWIVQLMISIVSWFIAVQFYL